MILIGRSLDRFKRDPYESKRDELIYDSIAGFRVRFDFKADPSNSEGVLNNSAKLTLKRPPLIKQVQH